MYKLTATTSILRLADNTTVPADPMNADYRAYQVWLAAGNTPEPALSFAQMQTAQIGVLTIACGEQIVGGFQSSALGSAHTYPSKPLDQQNLTASVLASVMPNLPSGWTTPFWCMDSKGVWTTQPHTAAQIQQAGIDGKAAILAAQVKLGTLSAQVMALPATTTQAELAAVIW
jgi:hypothetical protein